MATKFAKFSATYTFWVRPLAKYICTCSIFWCKCNTTGDQIHNAKEYSSDMTTRLTEAINNSQH